MTFVSKIIQKFVYYRFACKSNNDKEKEKDDNSGEEA